MSCGSSSEPGETAPLLVRSHPRGVGEVGLMKHRDIRRAISMSDRAFEGDPMVEYLTEGDTTPFLHLRGKFKRALMWSGAIYQGRLLTIDAGDAILQYGAPNDVAPPLYVRVLLSILSWFPSREAIERRKEADAKIDSMITSAFGSLDRLDAMYEIRALAVSPDKQGRGYGGALVNTVLTMSDAAGRDSWVITTRAYGFYESLGYVIAAKCYLGEGNPTWHKSLPEIILMHRRANSASMD